MKMIRKLLLTAFLTIFFSGIVVAEEKKFLLNWEISIHSPIKVINGHKIKMEAGLAYDDQKRYLLYQSSRWRCEFYGHTLKKITEHINMICFLRSNPKIQFSSDASCAIKGALPYLGTTFYVSEENFDKPTVVQTYCSRAK